MFKFFMKYLKFLGFLSALVFLTCLGVTSLSVNVYDLQVVYTICLSIMWIYIFAKVIELIWEILKGEE